MKTRNTIQRQLVFDAVEKLGNHPTAEDVYQQVLLVYPDISLATVYRNLNLLSDNGRLYKISVPGAADRFDHTNYPHYHVQCGTCGSISDIEVAYLAKMDQQASRASGYKVLCHEIIFHGLCPKCIETSHS